MEGADQKRGRGRPRSAPKPPRELTPLQQAASAMAKARAEKLGQKRCHEIALIAVRSRESRRKEKRLAGVATIKAVRPPQGATA